MSALILPSFTLWQREIVRFYRQRSRVVGAAVPPILFWFLIGSGFGSSFRHGLAVQMNYLQFFFPGTVVMVILFTSIFSTISIIEDRKEGFLQSVLVAPVWRASIALGKVLGGATIAFLQGLLFVVISPLFGLRPELRMIPLILLVLFLCAFGLTALGFWIAWKMDSTQGFHAVMNLFLMPMWFLSGALFPLDGAPFWLRAAMLANPLTYGVSALRQALYSRHFPEASAFPPVPLSLAVLAGFALFMFALAAFTASRNPSSKP